MAIQLLLLERKVMGVWGREDDAAAKQMFYILKTKIGRNTTCTVIQKCGIGDEVEE